MPAVNTPQFSWVRSKLPRHPQPVPPIYQPEVAARGVLYAADHPGRRQYWIGASTAATIIADKVIPALLDRYLARTGYDSQQTDQPARPRAGPGNLARAADGQAGTGPRRARDLRQQGASAQRAAVGGRASAGHRRAAAAAVVVAGAALAQTAGQPPVTGRPDRAAPRNLLDAARAGYGGAAAGRAAPDHRRVGTAVPAGPRAVGVARVLGATATCCRPR